MTNALTGRVTTAEPALKDFTRSRKKIRFRIDDDVFEAAPALPAETLVAFANRFADVTDKRLNASELYSAIREVLELVLLPGSYSLLVKRMSDQSSPVDLEQMSEAVLWLVEEYGLRPTELSSSSPSGPVPPAPGTGSTASTPDGESTSAPFPLTGS